MGDSGDISGRLTIEQGDDGAQRLADRNDNVVSTIVNLDGDIEGSIELCFWVDEENVERDDTALSYYDETDDCWKEEDSELEERGSREMNGTKQTLVCGETDHFTSFAVLLGANAGQDGVCGSDDNAADIDYLILILSASSIGVAIVTVIIILIVATILDIKKKVQLNSF